MTILVVLAVLLALVALVSIAVLAYDLRESRTPLYEVPESAGEMSLERDGPTTAVLSLTVCVDDDVPHVTLLAQEWHGPIAFPGSVRVFTASPGCHTYRFSQLPLPPADEPADAACARWTISGVVLPSDADRPGESFGTAPVCVRDIPSAAA